MVATQASRGLRGPPRAPPGPAGPAWMPSAYHIRPHRPWHDVRAPVPLLCACMGMRYQFKLSWNCDQAVKRGIVRDFVPDCNGFATYGAKLEPLYGRRCCCHDRWLLSPGALASTSRCMPEAPAVATQAPRGARNPPRAPPGPPGPDARPWRCAVSLNACGVHILLLQWRG